MVVFKLVDIAIIIILAIILQIIYEGAFDLNNVKSKYLYKRTTMSRNMAVRLADIASTFSIVNIDNRQRMQSLALWRLYRM